MSKNITHIKVDENNPFHQVPEKGDIVSIFEGKNSGIVVDKWFHDGRDEWVIVVDCGGDSWINASPFQSETVVLMKTVQNFADAVRQEKEAKIAFVENFAPEQLKFITEW